MEAGPGACWAQAGAGEEADATRHVLKDAEMACVAMDGLSQPARQEGCVPSAPLTVEAVELREVAGMPRLPSSGCVRC